MKDENTYDPKGKWLECLDNHNAQYDQTTDTYLCTIDGLKFSGLIWREYHPQKGAE